MSTTRFSAAKECRITEALNGERSGTMVQVDLKQLVNRLDDSARHALEGAVGLCLTRTNYHVEIEHWLLKLLEQSNTDFIAFLQQFGVDQSRMIRDVTRVVDSFRMGNSREASLSPDLVELARAAWLIASINYRSPVARTGHILCALVSDDRLARIASSASDEFAKVLPDVLRTQLPQMLAKTGEASSAAGDVSASASATPKGPTSTPALDQFTIDLTERARLGHIDPVLGRDAELRQIVDILMRRRQNNPILTGEAGVGKTAVVEGFALRVAAGDVPPSLRNVSVRSLDMGLLQAGAGIKGEFENRLKSVIKEVTASPQPVILFIDEAHSLIGAGAGSGQGDAANLLKPALARGELRTIAATTWAEYKKYFEKDAALARRFQVVKVDEPDEQRAVEMMRGLAATLEQHHKVRVLDEAIVDAVRLSSRYISGRQLPDKSLSLLDTTCARIGLSRTATPPAIEDGRRRLEQVAVKSGNLRRETELGADHQSELDALAAEKARIEQDLDGLEQRWSRERQLVDAIIELRAKVTGASNGSPANDRQALFAELKCREKELRSLQGETPLVHADVNSHAISQTVAAWTGIPVGRMMADQVSTVLNLKSLMEKQIVGQSHALDRIAQSIRTSRANLTDPRMPVGVFLLAGTSGVGKTETAIVLSELLYGGPQNMTVINMSEFKEEHKVSLLMGSPPGYVGYGEGGVLTEAVRRKPYSVVLLDEMEKCHAGVQDIFYQVFDKGTLRDGEGRDIDFRNTVILMTTNAGTDLIKKLCADPDTAPDPEAFVGAVFPELLKTFKPAFLGRVTIIPYYPLSDEVMRKIITLKLGKVGRRVEEHYKATFSYAPEVIDTIARRCTEVDTGARNVDHILTRTLLPEMSAEFLARMAEGKAIREVRISVAGDETFRYDLA
jgi:type VI secretion system protein VasG